MNKLTGEKLGYVRVYWTLEDSTSKYFNVWRSSAGYRESFFKGEDPNITKPYGTNGDRR